MKERADSEKVSPTAYATGYFWYRHGLSHPGFLIPEGRRMDLRFRLLMGLVKAVSGVSIEALMLARHKGIDALLARHIESGKVTQVVELAAGLSPRGWRFTERFPQLKYVEADLPDMARRKKELLREANALSERHKVVTCNILVEGPESLENVISREFDTTKPLLVVTEGLVNYFNLETISGFWGRLHSALEKFPVGIYLMDNYPLLNRHPFRLLLKVLGDTLGAASRSNVSFHFSSDEEMEAHFHALGFRQATAHNPRDYYGQLAIPETRGDSFVRILAARS